ncbi:uncharacterized protein LOC122292754 [Carya illinoinensis]|uniref:uncharacterized protein LOC122292754 n=1 Tax=Carya illinoinensis TaxID=32201 RepID=UPI001C71E037|nr:uncharacterized protein LOC122292754 [Carya illinoinensis]
MLGEGNTYWSWEMVKHLYFRIVVEVQGRKKKTVYEAEGVSESISPCAVRSSQPLSLEYLAANQLTQQPPKNSPIVTQQLSYFLGIQVATDHTGLHLKQSKYIFDLLEKTRMIGARPLASPTVSGTKLSAHESGLLEDATEYRQIVGAL